MLSKILILGFALGLASCSQDLPGVQQTQSPEILPTIRTATIKNQTFSLEDAHTPEQKDKGLKFRSSIGEDEGMLFTFIPRAKPKFFMHEVYIPLDIVFVTNGKVVGLDSMKPCKAKKEECPTFSPPVRIDYAIELKAGTSEKLGLVVGDEVAIN
jgi:uncharacterized membrane protein (UPF0127 family)